MLRHILTADFVGAAELRSQIDRVEVVAVWQLGSTSVDLRVKTSTARSPWRGSLAPVDAQVMDSAGGYTGELLVWLDSGFLSALEHTWITDEMPTVLPPVEQISLHYPAWADRSTTCDHS